jgi:hypothetical protein
MAPLQLSSGVRPLRHPPSRMKYSAIILVLSAQACTRPDSRVTDSSVAATSDPSMSAQPLLIRWPSDRDENQPGPLDSLRAKAPRCSTAPAAITKDSIGHLKPSLTLAEVSSLCPDAMPLWDWGDEGIPEPALFLRLGQSLVELTLEDTLATSRVTYVRSGDSSLRTPSGIGPGSLFRDLTRVYGTPHLQDAECVLYATFDSAAGLSFRLDMPGEQKCETIPGMAHRKEWRKLPAGTRVSDVILYPPAAGA